LWSDYYGGTDRSGNEFRYDVSVTHKAPKKRSEFFNSNIATESEIQDAKMEYWNKLKP